MTRVNGTALAKLDQEALRGPRERTRVVTGNGRRTGDDISSVGLVNVASVPQRSPFSYPGGKTWLVPYVRAWLESLETRPGLLVEPFAGGAIVGLTAALENLAAHVVLVEKDSNVASVWKTILEGNAGWLARRIELFDLTIENVREELERQHPREKERAFATILRNRVQRGGIMAPGPV